MCCEECSKYEKCESEDRLKEDCCPLCEHYYDCAGLDNRKKDKEKELHSGKDSEADDVDNEDTFYEE